MTEARYRELMDSAEARLTESEMAEGWHFCDEFDALLIGPGTPELEFCRCLAPDHPAYKTSTNT
jgi:hypothetical protein